MNGDVVLVPVVVIVVTAVIVVMVRVVVVRVQKGRQGWCFNIFLKYFCI